MKKTKKIFSTVAVAAMLTIGLASNVLAQPNGYYVNGTEYLISDVSANPSLLATINNELAANPSSFALDLNGYRASYSTFIASLAGANASLDSFMKFAQSHSFQVPTGSTVYNPANPKQPITNTDASSGFSVLSIN